MDFKIILLGFIASAGWLYLIANRFRYARQAARLDYDALASYRMNQPGFGLDTDTTSID